MLNIIGASSSLDDLQPVIDAAIKTDGCRVHMYGKGECRKGRKMGHITITADSDAQLRSRLRPLLLALPNASQEEADLYCPPIPAPAHNHTSPLVSVIMGSDSDLPVMIPAARILEKFNIPYELTIVSAHRTPDRMVTFARTAAARGVRVIIAGAGGAAHLPGMVAALTALPVIGVPVKGSSLDGVDSLHSIVQMPVSFFLQSHTSRSVMLTCLSEGHSRRDRGYQQRHECWFACDSYSVSGVAAIGNCNGRVYGEHGG
jgi:phosphoribosylaminoimidazole carboxylase